MENLSLYSVSFLTFSALPQTALALTDLGTFTYPTSTALESVNKYAVFAQTYNKNNHMEGTIAANYINAGTDAFGVTSAVEQYVDKDEAFCYFAHVVGLGNMSGPDALQEGSSPARLRRPTPRLLRLGVAWYAEKNRSDTGGSSNSGTLLFAGISLWSMMFPRNVVSSAE